MLPQTMALVVAGILMGGFAGNEMTHGGFSEAMGLGHHHMLDAEGIHCAGPGDPDWEEHVAHMHNRTAHCGAGHMRHGMP